MISDQSNAVGPNDKILQAKKIAEIERNSCEITSQFILFATQKRFKMDRSRQPEPKARNSSPSVPTIRVRQARDCQTRTGLNTARVVTVTLDSSGRAASVVRPARRQSSDPRGVSRPARAVSRPKQSSAGAQRHRDCDRRPAGRKN